ncbi:MAG: histidine kinase dimerization/phospho-acceptor domain-containing protein, partial [Clostridia bacterium]|nr:histidine kinase dimerization/phospho-acceptor domain-containing protein [Clostridia bacterium]
MKKNYHKLLIILPLLISVLLIVYIILESEIHHNAWINEPVHSAIEIAGAVTAIYVSIVLRNSKIWTFDTKGLEIGFLMMGILDIFHSILPPGQGFVYLHSIARLMGGIGFVHFTVFNMIKGRYRLKHKTVLFGILAISIAIGVSAVVFPSFIPTMVKDGQFTSFALILNILGGILFMTGALYFIVQYNKNKNIFSLLFFSVAFLFGVSNLTFSFSSLWSHSWWAWHFLSFFAYLIVMGFIFYWADQSKLLLEKRNREFNEINKKLNNYTYTISHDLKEPVRSIRTFSEFIAEDNEEAFDDTTKDYFQRIIKASARIADMIDNLLIISRIGRTDIEFFTVSSKELVSEVLEELDALITETETEITLHNLPEIICQPL